MWDISGLDKVEVLRFLWLNAIPTYYEYGTVYKPDVFDEDAAAEAVKGYVKYFCDRLINVDFSSEMIDLYDYIITSNHPVRLPSSPSIDKSAGE